MDLSTANIPAGLTISSIPNIPTSNGNAMIATNNNGSRNDNGIQTTITTTTLSNSDSRYPNRRVLRPRVEARSYAEVESPDINLNGDKTEKSTNGELDSDDEDAAMPEIEIKELSAAEIWERERMLRKIREELRNEETKLVLLKKIKHSQNQTQVMKENKTPSNMSHGAQNLSQNYNNPLSMLPHSLSKGSLTVIPTNLADYKGGASITRQSSINDNQAQCFPLPRQSLPGGATLTSGTSSRTPFIQGKTVMEGRSSSNLSITPSVTITPTSGPVMNLKTKNQSSVNLNNSVSITPTASISISQNNSMNQSSRIEDNQTQAQKQAAAKLALRKQLEKTLLQIPPPKPPPPEMHFIPNPSNGEFVYLLGLEHVVDYLTKDKKTTPQPQQPFRCAQCKIDFTPVWKMEKDKRGGSDATPRIICESCVTTNVKKALKAEHTNRLKTAFVKALQQEQEIEQRMASQSSSSSSGAADFSMHSPAQQSSSSSVTIQPQQHQSAPVALSPAPSKTPRLENSNPRPAPTPPNQSTPPPQSSSSRGSSSSRHQSANAAAQAAAAAAAADPMGSMTFAAQLNALASLGNFGNLGGNFGNSSQTAAAMQAFQQQIFRGIQGMSGMGSGMGSSNQQQQQANLAAQMQFGPLLYSYQLAMAQAAQQQAQQASSSKGKGKGNKSSSSNNVALDMQRALEMQRQYLEMLSQAQQMPNQRGGGNNNWKNH